MHGRDRFLFHTGNEHGDPPQGCLIVSRFLMNAIEFCVDPELIVHDSDDESRPYVDRTRRLPPYKKPSLHQATGGVSR